MAEQQVRTVAGVRVLCLERKDPVLATVDDMLDVISAAMGARADMVLVPLERLDRSFFELSTGMAGALLQKLVNYGLHLVVVGDISAALCESRALRDFVRESNRGRHVWFVASHAELEARLASH